MEHISLEAQDCFFPSSNYWFKKVMLTHGSGGNKESKNKYLTFFVRCANTPALRLRPTQKLDDGVGEDGGTRVRSQWPRSSFPWRSSFSWETVWIPRWIRVWKCEALNSGQSSQRHENYNLRCGGRNVYSLLPFCLYTGFDSETKDPTTMYGDQKFKSPTWTLRPPSRVHTMYENEELREPEDALGACS